MIELKSISAVVVAMVTTIAEEYFPYDCNDCWLFFSSDRSDHMETSLYYAPNGRELEKWLSAKKSGFGHVAVYRIEN